MDDTTSGGDPPATSTFCPGCGTESIGTLDLLGEPVGKPAEGAVTICSTCAEVSVFDAHGVRVPPSDDDWIRLRHDRGVRLARAHVHDLIARRVTARKDRP